MSNIWKFPGWPQGGWSCGEAQGFTVAWAGWVTFIFSQIQLVFIPSFLQWAQGAFILRPFKVLHLCEVEKNSEPPRCPMVRDPESSLLRPKPTAELGPEPISRAEKVHTWEPDGPSHHWAQLLLLLPLFSEAFWDYSGHILNITGDQGTTKAGKARLTQNCKQVHYQSPGWILKNLLVQRRRKTDKPETETRYSRAMGLRKGLPGESRSRYLPLLVISCVPLLPMCKARGSSRKLWPGHSEAKYII